MAAVNGSKTITAASLEEALREGAVMLGVLTDAVHGQVIKRGKDGSVVVQVSVVSEQGAKRAQELLQRLDREMTNIETDEMLLGLTAEELDEKGLIGEKKLTPERSAYSNAAIVCGFEFANNVEYKVFADLGKPSDIPFEDIVHLGSVNAGLQVARKKIDIPTKQRASFTPGGIYTEVYLHSCNLEITFSNPYLEFRSTMAGKLLVVGEMLYLVEERREGKCEVRVAPDRMSARADLYPSMGGGKALSDTVIVDTISKAGIVFGLFRDAFVEAARTAEEKKSIQRDVLIASGVEPVHGKDAEIKLFFSQEVTIDDLKVLPDGRVDYRRKANIQIVPQGMLLASITEPEAGKDGMDVFGNVLKGQGGDAKVLYCGENVATDEKGHEFYAECVGMPSLNKNVLSILQQYHVPGDVDYASGNIEFQGNVTVSGNVLPGFEVKATGDIVITGNVESGTLDAGRDIKVFGGIIGGQNSRIRAGRNVYANHLQNALVEAQGDVLIKNSSVHSEVYCTGELIAREGKGAFIGGLASAFRTVDILTAGSPAGARTELIAGQDFLLIKLKDEFVASREFCVTNIGKLEKFLKPLIEIKRSGVELDPDQRSRIALVVKKHRELIRHLREMDARMKQIDKEAVCKDIVMIRVKLAVFPDVKITVKDVSMVLRTKEQNVRFLLNEKTGVIETSPC